MATLARFRAGLRPEYQRELVLQEVSTLEKAYRYTLNMELYATHAHKSHTPEIATTEVTRYVQNGSRNPLSTLPTPVNTQTTPSPPRLLLPTPSSTPPTTATSNAGSRLGTPLGPQSNRFGNPSMNEQTPVGRIQGGTRPRPPPTSPSSTGSRVACYKCQGWGHFASQCPSPWQTARPARALLVEIQDDAHLPPANDEESIAKIYEANPELAQAFKGSPTVIGCIIKELKPLTNEEHTLDVAVPLSTMLSELPTT